jgi:hypothetical protein
LKTGRATRPTHSVTTTFYQQVATFSTVGHCARV